MLYKIKRSTIITVRLIEIRYRNYGIKAPYATKIIAKTSS
jgi:hypothetical protein